MNRLFLEVPGEVTFGGHIHSLFVSSLVVQHSHSPQFVNFVCKGLEEIEAQEWREELSDFGAAAKLLIKIKAFEPTFHLTQRYKDTHQILGKQLLDDDANLEPSDGDWRVLIGCIDEPLQAVLSRDLLDASLRKDEMTESFIRRYGTVIGRPEILGDSGRVVRVLFSPLLRGDSKLLLEWLASASGSGHESFRKDPPEDVQQFVGLIRERLRALPADDELRSLIERIGTTWNVEIASEDSSEQK
ncbi:hypothetical protein GC207_13345 [bacterium]|nr:hypothetical protein [bacterium]